jgi:hypothetical protein
VSPVDSRPVGSTTARVVHGHTAGADAVLLGAGAGDLDVALGALGVSPPARLQGRLADQLSALAEAVGSASDRPFVAAACDLDLALPALLDLLDRPGVGTAALVADPWVVTGSPPALARVGRDGRLVESVGTPGHVVSDPTHVLPGILRIAAGDREHAAGLLRQAATAATPAWGDDALAVAVLVLVRGGVAVQASALGPFSWRRGRTTATGSAGDAWRQRLRGASRGGDGFFSTYAVRPLSRRLTAVGLAHDWSPNVVTVVSLGFGLLAAVLVATGWWWAWAVAAIVLLLALVVDCVDGELARFTRRFSPLGAFLDAVGDRVKEYAVLAAVAAVAVREGAPGWPVAIAAMAAVTVRHLEDYAYEYRLGPSRRSTPDPRPAPDRPHRRPRSSRRCTGPRRSSTCPSPSATCCWR